MRLRYSLPTREATVNQWHIAERINGNELVTLSDYVADRGAIVSRPHVLKLDTQNINGTRVQGAYSWRQGTNANWLLIAVADGTTEQAQMIALLVDFTKAAPGDVIRQKIVCTEEHKSSALIGQHYNFLEYRGRVFVSNGFETCVFDGQKWSEWNQTDSAEGWRRCGRDIAFNSAVVFQDRAVLLGNRGYLEELTYAKIFEDWDEKTRWTGYEELGGFEGEIPITTLRALAFSGSVGYLGGDGGALFYSPNSGLKWTAIDAPSDDYNFRAIAAVGANVWVMVTKSGEDIAIFKSENYGANWSDPLPVVIGGAPGGLDFPTALIGYAGGVNYAAGNSYIVVAKTIDGGDNWIHEGTISGDSGKIYDLDFVSATTGFVAADIDIYGFVIFRTTDGGDNWIREILEEALPGFKPRSISAVDGNHWIMVGEYVTGTGGNPSGAIVRGIYDGSDWVIALSDYDGGKDLNAVLFYSTINAIAVGEEGTILRTTDGGAKWNPASINPAQMDFFDVQKSGNRLYACGDGGQLFYSDDDGVNWYAVETKTDKFTSSLMFAPGEEIRANIKAFGSLLVFTSNNIYSLHDQFGQQLVCAGVEVLNDRCVAEMWGRVWFTGRYQGVPGVWAWDGNTPPVLMSRRVQTTIDGLNFEPSPKSILVKFDTQGEFTQPSGIGFYYNTNVFRLKDGVLYCNRGSSGRIYSHYDHSTGLVNSDTGFFFPDIDSTDSTPNGSFGTLSLEIALNESYVGEDFKKVGCQIEVRVAPSDSTGIAPDDDEWTQWTHIVPNGLCPGVEWSLPFNGQGVVFARYVMPIDHRQLPGYIKTNEPYRWMQFSIIAYNEPFGINKSNWRLNRIALIPQVNLNVGTADTPASPSMLVWDDKLWIHFGHTTIVYSNGGNSVSTASFSNANCSVSVGGKMVIGDRGSAQSNPILSYTQDNMPDWIGATPTLQTGRIDWSDVDPKLTDINKILRRITVRAKPSIPSPNGAGVTVTWWADGNTANVGTATLVFNDTHNPTDPLGAKYQVRSVELQSAPSSVFNYGKDFAVKIERNVGGADTVDILGVSIECDTVTDEPQETNVEA